MLKCLPRLLNTPIELCRKVIFPICVLGIAQKWF